LFFILFKKILPHKQKQLSLLIGRSVAENFISAEMIEQKITDPKNLQKIMPVVEEHIDDFLRNKLKKQMPVIGMFIGDKTINSLKEVFIKELEHLFPQVMKNFASNMKEDLDIEQLVSEKINAISIPQLEKTVRSNLSTEIRYLSVSSAAVGLAIGIITAIIIYFIK